MSIVGASNMTNSQIFVIFLICANFYVVNCHRLFRHHIPIEKKEIEFEKAKEEEVHPFFFRRPYSVTKEIWFPFGSFGYKRHIDVKRDTEEVLSPIEVKEAEVKGGDLDELLKLPGPENLHPGPEVAEPLPPDTPVIRPLNAPPVPVVPVNVESPVLEKVEGPAPGLNTDVKPFVNSVPPPVRGIEENLVVPPPPPVVEEPEGFGTYMKKGRELILDFGRFIFTRMSELLDRARNFRLISSRTIAS